MDPLANTYVRSREIEIYSRSARGSENTTPSGASTQSHPQLRRRMTHWFRAGGTEEAFPPLAAVRVHLHGAQIVSGWVCEHATPCHRASRSRLQTERAAFVSIRSRDGVRNGEYLHSRRGNLRFPCWTGVGTVYTRPPAGVGIRSPLSSLRQGRYWFCMHA